MQELWRPVVGLESDYLISSFGQVYSLISQKMMRQPLLDGRYPACVMKGKMRKAHQLVTEAWHGPRPEGMYALHKDDNKLNNTPDNLYWGTLSQNQLDCTRNGHRHDQRGFANPSAKLNEDLVRQIRASKSSYTAIAKQFGISRRNVGLIKSRKAWAHCA